MFVGESSQHDLGNLPNRLTMSRNKDSGYKSSKSILILGETGGGKSTFINMITNYFKNGSLDNLKVAIPTKVSIVNVAKRNDNIQIVYAQCDNV